MIKDMKHFLEKEIFGREVDLLARRGVERSRNYIRRRAILEGVETYRNRDNEAFQHCRYWNALCNQVQGRVA